MTLVHKAVDACKSVLRGLHGNKIVQRELDRAKRTLLMRHEAETKSNAYWLGLLAYLQASSVPRKDVSCIKDLIFLYEAATVEDVYVAYETLKVDDESLYACVGIAGNQAGEDFSASHDCKAAFSIELIRVQVLAFPRKMQCSLKSHFFYGNVNTLMVIYYLLFKEKEFA
ncbi:hypothetical protein Taro_005484 [Colocasia esculenta]|uniref:Uncharacterized protein n=1 Tax=Colocasia esculenta TaxID=4460 RepID=A0A843TY07_COLES|nr:hypothetical protein [Colocasia esculenta]